MEGAEAQVLVELAGTFEDLQTVLQCCERLVTALAGEHDDVLVEALWTTAMLSYARSFAPGKGSALTEADLAATKLEGDLVEWHQLLLRLREHHADPAINPREIFSVGVAQDAQGAASGVALTSARQPSVDDLTVRQTGAIAYALSQLVNDRIEALQKELFEELKETPRAELDELVVLDVAPLDVTP
ncbi:MAG: hypothetical protein H0X12_01905 [Nocardioides sp.]|nr:hypothetical protein [Nocardioides sp.]